MIPSHFPSKRDNHKKLLAYWIHRCRLVGKRDNEQFGETFHFFSSGTAIKDSSRAIWTISHLPLFSYSFHSSNGPSGDPSLYCGSRFGSELLLWNIGNRIHRSSLQLSHRQFLQWFSSYWNVWKDLPSFGIFPFLGTVIHTVSLDYCTLLSPTMMPTSQMWLEATVALDLFSISTTADRFSVLTPLLPLVW